MAQSLKAVAALLSMLPLCVAASAEALVDPTRPPAALARARASASSGEAEAAGAGLHSIFYSESRRFAIIDGRQVMTGDRVGNARIVRIAEDEVVLQEDGRLRSMKLYPDVQKNYALTGSNGSIPEAKKSKK
ncbi:MSHA biogenesis protein MshK [Noviherbaspirillum humi]|uniref:MSHA biogenesis protein MshK n=1 Tax=Noviherbaspirillum humi TaxID=1688639 RepID=A0A239HQD2_9BURK|nr:MSHA biogenesis protein MshK [Noviherbaspirillum humi]SNS82494.1 MSHA biogenesis protein MshK [Noviherbaspirillum humi]